MRETTVESPYLDLRTPWISGYVERKPLSRAHPFFTSVNLLRFAWIGLTSKSDISTEFLRPEDTLPPLCSISIALGYDLWVRGLICTRHKWSGKWKSREMLLIPRHPCALGLVVGLHEKTVYMNDLGCGFVIWSLVSEPSWHRSTGCTMERKRKLTGFSFEKKVANIIKSVEDKRFA